MSNEPSLITTADQLLVASKGLGSCELVRGELIVRPYMGVYETHITSNLLISVGDYAKSHDLGVCVSRPAGFLMEKDPDTVRAPSVSLICKDRVPRPPGNGFFAGPPDLAIEICPPDTAPNAMADKADDHLRLGVRVVWEVDPGHRIIAVHRLDIQPQILAESATLTEPALLPGFEMPVKDVFA